MPVGHGGPEMAPKPPFARRAPAAPSRAPLTVAGDGAPRWPPNPPSLVAPRRRRGAPRSQSQVMGPRDGPQTPLRSSRPGGAVARLDHSRDGAPRWPNPANV